MNTDNHPGPARTSNSYRVAAIGEVLWDIFPSGPRFGGAPANFASTLAALDSSATHVSMVSAVGKDLLGSNALSALQANGVDTTWVTVLDYATGQVLIELDGAGRASYEFAANTAWDNLPWSDELAEFAQHIDAVCFGTLGQRNPVSRDTIRHFLAATNEPALRICDLNFRPPFYGDDDILASLAFANVLKLNDEELPILAKLYQLSGSEITMLTQLADRFELQAIALTNGPRGAILMRGPDIDERPAAATTVIDTVGAGDAYTATVAMGLLRNESVAAINKHACTIAEFVCSQAGATPRIPSHLINE